MKPIFTGACVFLLLLPIAAKAERADALKRVNVEYDDIHFDNVTQVMIATGKVVISRGTTVLKSGRAEIRETPDGYRIFVLTATPGTLASFRTKSDRGSDIWSEGHAERIEYDERADTVKLFSQAMIRQLDGANITHQMEQAFISYDSRKEVMVGQNDPTGADRPFAGRGTITLEPHRTLTTTPPKAPSLKP